MSEKQKLREDADGLENDGESPEKLVPEGKELILAKLSIKARGYPQWIERGFSPTTYLQEPV